MKRLLLLLLAAALASASALAADAGALTETVHDEAGLLSDNAADSVACYNEMLGRDAIYVFIGCPAEQIPADAVAIVAGTEQSGIYPGPDCAVSEKDAAHISRQTLERSEDIDTAIVQAADMVFSAISPVENRPASHLLWMAAAVLILAAVLVLLVKAVLGSLAGGLVPLRRRDMFAYDGRKAAIGRDGFRQPFSRRSGGNKI